MKHCDRAGADCGALRSRGGSAAVSAHTPGPWRVATRRGTDAFYIVEAAGVEAAGPECPMWQGYRVAHVQDCNELMQNTANACLIAAAPDLLAALKACLASFDEVDRASELGRQVKAAIKRAEGARP